MKKRVIELLRVSTQAQAGDDRAGIPAQRQINRKTAKAYGLEIVKSIQIVDVSGAAVLACSEMHDLLRSIESPNIVGVVTREFSRLIRPEKFTDLALLEAFTETKTVLYLPDGPIDFCTRTGKLLGTIRAAFAGLERQEIRDRMHDAKEAMRRDGRHPGGSATLPYGIGYSKERGWFYTEDAEKVKRAFAMFLRGDLNYAEIGRRLNIPRTSVRYILENEIYQGVRVYDQKRDSSREGYVAAQNGRQGYRRKIDRSADEIIRVPVLKELVSADDFARVQRVIESKRRNHWRSRSGMPHRYTYNGFLTCGGCGQLLYTHTSKSDYYICKSRHTRERKKRALQDVMPCTNRYMLRERLEPKIDNLIGEKVQTPQFLTQLVEEFKKTANGPSVSEEANIDASVVRRKLESLGDKRNRILETFYEGAIDRKQRDHALEGVDREISAYEIVLGSASTREAIQPIANLASLLHLLQPFAEWEFLTREQRRRLLKEFCPKISVYHYAIKSLTLNVDSLVAPSFDRDNVSRWKMDASRSPGRRFR